MQSDILYIIQHQSNQRHTSYNIRVIKVTIHTTYIIQHQSNQSHLQNCESWVKVSSRVAEQDMHGVPPASDSPLPSTSEMLTITYPTHLEQTFLQHLKQYHDVIDKI